MSEGVKLMKPCETEHTQEVLGGAMHDICMLLSEECTERLVNSTLFWLCILLVFSCCSLPTCFSTLFIFSGVGEIWIIVLQCIIYDNSHSAVGSCDWRYAEGEELSFIILLLLL